MPLRGHFDTIFELCGHPTSGRPCYTGKDFKDMGNMKRILLDVVLFGLLFYLMAFRLLPRKPHEAIGVALPLLVILHLVWNRGWFSSLPYGRWNRLRIVFAVVNIGLIISFIVSMVSGLAVAHRLFPGIFGIVWQKSQFVRQIHIASSYWMMIFAGLHLGLHWKSLWARFMRFCGCNVSHRGYRLFSRMATAAVVAGGIYGSFLNRMGDRVMMVEFIRQTPATRLPKPAFLLVLLCIFGLWTAIGYAAVEYGKRRKG